MRLTKTAPHAHRVATFSLGCLLAACLLLTGGALLAGCASPSAAPPKEPATSDVEALSADPLMDIPFDADSQGEASAPPTVDAANEAKQPADQEAGGALAITAQERSAAALAEGQAVEERIAAGDASAKICYLTFDDGPSESTPLILETLSRYGVFATWFIQGNSAQIDYVTDIDAAGHGLGLHTYSHHYAQLYASDSAYFADLAAVQDAVSQRTGQALDIVRFPGGTSNTVSANYSAGIMSRLASSVPARGYQYFDWNLSGGDSSNPPPPASGIANNVLSNVGGQQRLCVLMHDTTVKRTTAEALPQVIEGLRDHGYTFGILTHDTPPFHHQPGN